MDRTASLEALERAAERGSSGRIREDVSSLTAFLASELDEVAENSHFAGRLRKGP